jgi:two-component system OmpR family sensor kinase
MAAERRRVRLGFRARVLGFAGLLLIGAVGVGLLVQRAVLLERLDRNVTTSLEQEADEMRTLATEGRNPETAEPFAGDVAAIFETFLSRNLPGPSEAYMTFVDGELHRQSLAAQVLDVNHPEVVGRWARLDEGVRGEVDTVAGPVRYLAVPLESDGEVQGVFVVLNLLEDQRRAIDAEIRVLALVAAAVVAVTLAIAWSTAGRLLRPLREVTETARTISETDLSRRIPVEGHDEVAELATTFNQMLDRLETAFATQRAFVDDAGHELRTPITVVMGQLELMGDDPDDRAATLAVVEDELGRMARIVEDLLLLAKAEQADFVRPEPVELADLTTELLMKARSLGDREWSLDACAAGTVALDPQRITQAVLNLARNAVEHTDPGTAVAVGSQRVGDRLQLWVRDDGPGVAPADQERIFDRFSRGTHARRRSDGAGLGLSIVAAVAAGHGGRVALRSEPGQGATFTLDLPVEPDPTAATDPTEELAVPDPTTADDAERTEPWPAS